MKRTEIIIAGIVVALCATMVPQPVAAQAMRTGSPEDNLPPTITRLTGFGERAVWSPDGKRVAFMSKSFGDAFEIDLATRMTRLLTGHFRHAGFLRVHYLPNGDYFLIGARTFTDIRTTRDRDQEMWVMTAGARSAPIALSHRISEGVAISRKSATGVEPNGAWALVESSRDQGADRQDSRHIDLWTLSLVPNGGGSFVERGSGGGGIRDLPLQVERTMRRMRVAALRRGRGCGEAPTIRAACDHH